MFEIPDRYVRSGVAFGYWDTLLLLEDMDILGMTEL